MLVVSTAAVAADKREWAFDKGSHIGGLEQGLVEARAKGWTVVRMKDDWSRVFPQ